MSHRVISGLVALLVACGGRPTDVREPAPPATDLGAIDPVYRLPAGQTLYFWENHAEGSEYIELRPDGMYRTLSREHMGVGENDAGKWRQANNGELLLCSAYQFRIIESGPLWVVVVGKGMHDQLPQLRDAIRGFLTTHADASFASKEIEWPFGHEDYHRPSINSEAYDRNVTRAELLALAAAVDAYLANGDENLFRTTPRVYRNKSYLDGWWQVPRRPHDERGIERLHQEIEKGNSMLALLAIDETTFKASVRTPQPFVFYPEMNDCVGKALTSDDVRDAKPAHVEARCKSF